MVGAQFGGIKLPESMTWAFLVFVPFAVGAVTIHMAERHAPTRVSYWVIAPWLSVALFVASAANIWHHINYPTNIDPAELAGGVAYKISVPFPIEARTLSEGVGGQRQLIWQRGIRFSETITAWQQDRHIAWNY